MGEFLKITAGPYWPHLCLAHSGIRQADRLPISAFDRQARKVPKLPSLSIGLFAVFECPLKTSSGIEEGDVFFSQQEDAGFLFRHSIVPWVALGSWDEGSRSTVFSLRILRVGGGADVEGHLLQLSINFHWVWWVCESAVGGWGADQWESSLQIRPIGQSPAGNEGIFWSCG